MNCRYCKREIPENSVYCNWCGKSQLSQPRKQKTKITKPERLATGEYSGRVMVDGRRVRVKAETLSEYNATVAALKAGVISARYHADSSSLFDAMTSYVSKRRFVLSPSTINGYESICRTRFVAYHSKPINSIDFQRMINDEFALGVSARTIKNSWGFVKSVLRDLGITPPAVSVPQVVLKDLPWLDFEQILIFLDAVRGNSCELAALLALHSLRRSELLALTLDCVDLDKKHPERSVIHIRGSKVRGPSNAMVAKETNKTQTSRRDVPIMIPRLYDILSGLTGKDYLISVNPNSLHGMINGICQKAGLPLTGVHGLRRSFASLAYHLHWTELQTMTIGGWSDPTVVRKIYTKLAQADVDKGIQDMRDFYGFARKLPATSEKSS